MFAQQVGRTGRRLGQTAWRASRSTPSRGYATEGSSQKASGFRRGVSFTLSALVFSGIGAAGTWKAMNARGMGFYSDEESLRAYTPEESDADARRVEEAINTHPMVMELRKREDLTESRPHLKMPKEYRSRSLTGGVLQGSRKIVVPPYAWNDAEGREMTAIFYVGEDLCGHPGIVHGGLLATILDEGLARCCFKALPHNIAVTANLNINYRKPTPAGSFLVLRAETTKVDGRKGYVKGRLEKMVAPGEAPMVFAEAEALFISPKYAAVMPRIV